MRRFVLLCLLVAPACTTVENPCDLTCENGGLCSPQTGSCVCAAGFSGDLCEVEIDECAGDPCQNGSSCTDGVADFSCACLSGFAGQTCEINLDDCAGDPCLNGGTCADEVEDFTCTCTATFAGKTCQTCNPTEARIKNFTNQPTIGPPGVARYGQGEVEITGSANIHVLNFNGIGIVGGQSDNVIDTAEVMTFTFLNPSSAVVYNVQASNNGNANQTSADGFVEAFDENGLSLGVMPVNGNGDHDVSAMFGNALITKFTITADGDQQRIGGLNFNSCP